MTNTSPIVARVTLAVLYEMADGTVLSEIIAMRPESVQLKQDCPANPNTGRFDFACSEFSPGGSTRFAISGYLVGEHRKVTPEVERELGAVMRKGRGI